MPSELLFEVSDRIAHIQIKRPKQINAIHPSPAVTPWIIGLERAREMLHARSTVEAAEARRIGVLNRVVPDDEFERESWRHARRAAAHRCRESQFA